MHEFSIADALAAQVRRHAPPTGRVSEVEIRVGALRGIEPDALRMCWDAVTYGSELAGSLLLVDARPWTITCPSCRNRWESDVPFVVCACGNAEPEPAAGDELDLVSLTIEEEQTGGRDATPDSAATGADVSAPPSVPARAEGVLLAPAAARSSAGTGSVPFGTGGGA